MSAASSPANDLSELTPGWNKCRAPQESVADSRSAKGRIVQSLVYAS